MPTGMTETALYTWRNAERNIFDYLLSITGDTENSAAYLAELPKGLPATDSVKVWSFHITGTQEADMKPRPFWRLNAMIDGFFSNRIDAQRFAGKIMQACPIIPGTIASIELVRNMGFELKRGTRTLDEDLSRGGEDRIWMLEINLEVVAVNSTPEV